MRRRIWTLGSLGGIVGMILAALWMLGLPRQDQARRPEVEIREEVASGVTAARVQDRTPTRAGPAVTPDAQPLVPSRGTLEPSDEGGPGRVYGVLVAGAGSRGVAGARLELHWRDGDPGRAATTASGEWEFLVDRGRELLGITASGPGIVDGRIWSGSLLVVSGREHRLTLTAEQGRVVTGQVLRDTGEPLGGAEVHAVWSRERSLVPFGSGTWLAAADGSFRAEDVGPWAEWHAVAPGWRCTAHPSGAAEDGAIILRMEPTTALEVLVLDPEDRPVPGARLALMPTGRTASGPPGGHPVAGLAEAIAAADGRAWIAAAPGPHVLRVSAAGWLSVSEVRTLDESLMASPWVVRLESGGRVGGRVVDAAGDPVAGARVDLWGARDTTAADGRFVLSGIPIEPDQPRALIVVAEGHAPAVLEPILLEDGELRHVGDVALAAAAELAGQVQDALGRPVPWARVDLRGGRLVAHPGAEWERPPELIWLAGRALGWADGAGRFRFDGLADDEYEVVALADDLLGRSAARAGDQEVIVTLTREGLLSLTGSVRRAADGRAVTRFDLRTWQGPAAHDLWGRTVSIHDESGRFEIDGLPATWTAVEVIAAGLTRWRSEVVDLPAGTHGFEVVLHEARELALRVVSDRGTPVVGASVRCETPDGEPLSWTDASGTLRRETGTDGAGRARLQGLPAVALRLVLRAPGREDDEPLQWGPATRLDLDLSQPMFGEVECVVTALVEPPRR